MKRQWEIIKGIRKELPPYVKVHKEQKGKRAYTREEFKKAEKNWHEDCYELEDEKQ